MRRIRAWLGRHPIAAAALTTIIIASAAWAADTKISAFTDGGRTIATDEYVIARAGANNKITAENLLSANVIGQPRKRFYFYMDILNTAAAEVPPLVEAVSGTGASCQAVNINDASRVGLTTCDTGTTAAGRAILGIATPGVDIISLGGGPAVFETEVKVTDLSDVAQRYALILGFQDTGGVPQVDVVAFVYDEGGIVTGCSASANWQRYTVSNSVTTCTATSTAVGTSYTTLRVECNAGGTSCEFFIDGTSIGSNTTNIPTGTARALMLGDQIIKTIGTTQQDLYIDFLAAEVDFTTARD